MRLNIVIGLLGLIAGLLIAIIAGGAEKTVFAQGMSSGSMAMIPANLNNQQEDIVWVLDSSAKRLAVYRHKNNQVIELIGARNIKFDLQLSDFQYSNRHFTPREIEKETKKARKTKGQ